MSAEGVSKLTSGNASCLCHSGKAYVDCCLPFHKGLLYPDDPRKLVRARYAAYALGLVDFIVATTHSDNPSYRRDRQLWLKQLSQFCRSTEFVGLEIITCLNEDDASYVTFLAKLRQGDKDASFVEKSLFSKVNERWLYRAAVEWRSVKGSSTASMDQGRNVLKT